MQAAEQQTGIEAQAEQAEALFPPQFKIGLVGRDHAAVLARLPQRILGLHDEVGHAGTFPLAGEAGGG